MLSEPDPWIECDRLRRWLEYFAVYGSQMQFNAEERHVISFVERDASKALAGEEPREILKP